LINYLDVLDSQRTQLQAQIQVAQFRALQLVATVHLVKALGGGFTSDAAAGTPEKTGAKQSNPHPSTNPHPV
jgi:multidrug efflux system outer membrane protein